MIKEFTFNGVKYGFELDKGDYKPYGLFNIETEEDVDFYDEGHDEIYSACLRHVSDSWSN